MEPDEREALHALFRTANDVLGERFVLADETAADVLVIDLDSIYGQMTWLKARHGRRTIVALSSGTRAETGLSLTRPVSAEAIAGVLRELQAPDTAPAAPKPLPASAPAAPAAQAPEPVPVPPAEPEPLGTAAPPRVPRLGDHLEPGALSAPVRVVRAGVEALVLDPVTRVYFGPSALKALLPYCHGDMPADELVVLEPAQFAQVVKAGGAQPMARLRWLFALVSGEGRMLPGYGLDERYSLSKWPQIEREFPKHFRIATAMMKGPATLDEIAALSSSPLNEVIDFVNASLVSGFAQVDRPPPTDAEPAARGGLFDRLRGKKP
jgi:hypothetical protein